jgi:hypothetical protein
MLIWYISHYAVPPSFSLGWRCHYIASALSSGGHEVVVFAARRHHILSRPCGEIPYIENIEKGGYLFKTIDTPSYSGNRWGRIKNIRSFNINIRKEYINAHKTKLPELIIVSSPQLLVWKYIENIAAKKTTLIFEERDLWPESIIEFTKINKYNPICYYLNKIMKNIGKNADGVISLLPGTKLRFQQLGLPNDRWIWIPNGIEPYDININLNNNNQQKDEILQFNEARSLGKLIVLYAGSMGPPNALENIFKLADDRYREKSYKFFLLGDGISKKNLEKYIKKNKLDFIEFLPQTNRTESWKIMKNADIGFFCTKNTNLYRTNGLSFNKIFDYFGQKLPVIGLHSSNYDPILLSSGGISIKNYDYNSLHNTLNELSKYTQSQLYQIGLNGYNYTLRHHNWQILGRIYLEFCEQTVRNKRLY